MGAPADAMIEAFVPQNTLVLTADEVNGLSADELRRLFDDAAARSIRDVIVEVDEVPSALADAASESGLRLLIGVTCFHEHGGIGFGPRGSRRPIGADGRPRARLEWYVGLLPTDARVVAELVARCARLAATPGVAGIVLDFIRWPLHWELELRPNGPRLPAASFDEATLADFVSYTGIEVPRDAATAAEVLTTGLASEWKRYRCEVITDLVRVIAAVAHGAGAILGAFVVPIQAEDVGQDIGAWDGCIDAIYPMTYHAILHRSPQWVGEATDALRAVASMPVVPVLQVTASPSRSGGWDWGAEITPEELSHAVAEGSRRGAVGFFPGSAIELAGEVRLPSEEAVR